MKNSIPFSIKVIFWITEFIFWMMCAVSMIVIGFSVLTWTGVLDSLDLHTQSPLVFEYEYPGTLEIDGQRSEIEFVEVSGKIGYANTPRPIGIILTIAMIMASGLFLIAIYHFRKFIKNIKGGKFFSFENVQILKRIAITVFVFAVFSRVYFSLFYFYLLDKVDLPGFTATQNYEHLNWDFLFALFLWVLSHIFQKGLEIERENELTV